MEEVFQIPINRNILILPVGPPASGKSTWGKNYALKNNMVYISTDELRGIIGNSPSDQTVNEKVFKTARELLEKAFIDKKNAMVDATNINKRNRKVFVETAKKYNVYIIGVAFEVSREELIKRDSERKYKVGQEVIDKYINRYIRPVEGDEFDKVVIYNADLC